MSNIEKSDQPPAPFKYDNRTWSYDAREDPFAEGEPELVAFKDDIAEMLELHLYKLDNGLTVNETVEIDFKHAVNVRKCMQCDIDDKTKQRPVFRGEPNKRGKRPSDVRLGSNDFALKGKYAPVENIRNDDGSWNDGCLWLGFAY